MPAGARLVLPEDHEERAVYVVEGEVACDGDAIDEGAMAVFRHRAEAALQAHRPSRVMLLGGAPIGGARHIWWNFVSSSEQRIEQAKRDWTEGRFGKIPGDDVELIPLPDR